MVVNGGVQGRTVLFHPPWPTDQFVSSKLIQTDQFATDHLSSQTINVQLLPSAITCRTLEISSVQVQCKFITVKQKK